MKAKTAISFVAIIAASVFLSVSISTQNQVKAGEVVGSNETYKLVDAKDALDNPIAGVGLEGQLNTYAFQGWKVRATFGHYIILAK